VDLERAAARLRPRRPWEAMDLGTTFFQEWAGPILRPWFLVLTPPWVVVLWLTPTRPVLGWSLLYLLQAVAVVIPLHVASRALFGAVPTARETVRAVPGLLWRAGLGLWFVGRYGPSRAFWLPVVLLEGLRGRERRSRLDVLRRGQGSEAFLYTTMCALCAVGLFVALVQLAQWLLPDATDEAWGSTLEAYWRGEAPLGIHLGVGLLWLLVASIVEPLVVLGGFSLYLNRRTWLEGWDIELVFRALGRRLERERRRAGATLAAGWLLVVLGATALGAQEAERSWEPPRFVQGAASADERAQGRRAQEAVQRVLADDDFGSTRKVWTWRLRSQPEPSPRVAGEPWGARVDWSWVGTIFEVVAWAVLGIAVGAIGLAWARRVALGSPSLAPRVGDAPVPITTWEEAGGEALPGDVPAAAERLAAAGQPVAALSVLYRGALARLRNRDGLDVRPSWTEAECLRALAGRLARPQLALLERLVGAWLMAAYADRPPSADDVQELARRWRLDLGAEGPPR
jgi:hypothetical protein